MTIIFFSFWVQIINRIFVLKMSVQIIHTADGSNSLYSSGIDETYHSIHGAIQESNHIFIDAALRKLFGKSEIRIFEVGFGTGLNALLTALEAEQIKINIHYTTVELYPVEPDLALQLNYADFLKHKNAVTVFETIQRAEWNTTVRVSECFRIQKMKADFTTYRCDGGYDLVYFDAFSPEKQPEMWTPEIFEMLYSVCNAGAVLTTYCAKGSVRRALKEAGFAVERIPGPPGKREILRAKK